MKMYATGSGETLQAALDDAAANALESIQKANKKTEPMTAWKLVEVTGESGGIALLKVFNAKIEYDG